MNRTFGKYAGLGAASVLAAALLAGPAAADGMPSYGRTSSDAPSSRLCSTSGNVGLTTDYVFRGISQSDEEAAVQGGVDLSCGSWYLGVWGSSIDFESAGSAEVDIYGGYRFSTGRISWDAGLIYYAYPGADDPSAELDYVELKIGASTGLWKGGSVSGTVFYSPEYTGETGDVATYEVGFAQELPKVGMFSPTFSALYGYSDFMDDDFEDNSYGYWNAGLTLGFLEKWSLDLRYWDSENEGFATGELGEERFLGTVKYTF